MAIGFETYRGYLWFGIFRKLELFIKKIITVSGTANFWCDNHPYLCRNCILFRYRMRGFPKPKQIVINTKDKKYLCDVE